MTRPAARRAAAASTIAARRTAQNDPTARGADWRGATVDTVNADGTITTTDGVIARRMETYQAPAVGDLIHVSQAGSRNWRAEGRLSSGSDGWLTLPKGTNYSAASGYQAPQYRVVGDAVHLRGSFTKTTTLGYGDVFTVLPAGARPAADTDILLVCSQGTNGATYGACRGIIRTATGGIEYRGPAISMLIALPPTIIWTS